MVYLKNDLLKERFEGSFGLTLHAAAKSKSVEDDTKQKWKEKPSFADFRLIPDMVFRIPPLQVKYSILSLLKFLLKSLWSTCFFFGNINTTHFFWKEKQLEKCHPYFGLPFNQENRDLFYFLSYFSGLSKQILVKSREQVHLVSFDLIQLLLCGLDSNKGEHHF